MFDTTAGWFLLPAFVKRQCRVARSLSGNSAPIYPKVCTEGAKVRYTSGKEKKMSHEKSKIQKKKRKKRGKEGKRPENGERSESANFCCISVKDMAKTKDDTARRKRKITSQYRSWDLGRYRWNFDELNKEKGKASKASRNIFHFRTIRSQILKFCTIFCTLHDWIFRCTESPNSARRAEFCTLWQPCWTWQKTLRKYDAIPCTLSLTKEGVRLFDHLRPFDLSPSNLSLVFYFKIFFGTLTSDVTWYFVVFSRFLQHSDRNQKW